MITLDVIKIGGNVLNDPDTLDQFLNKFVENGNPKILIHGGGRKASEISAAMGLEPKMVEGRRITDAPTLEIVTMVYAGLINKNIVAQLAARDCQALGVTGADLNLIPAWKRKTKQIDYGFVGDFDAHKINTERIEWIISGKVVPVFCAITHDEEGQLLNTNADTLACGIAIALSGLFDIQLHLCFEKSGVLADADDESSLITELTALDFEKMKTAGSIFEGMIPKLDNAFLAKASGVKKVFIRHALGSIISGTKLTDHE